MQTRVFLCGNQDNSWITEQQNGWDGEEPPFQTPAEARSPRPSCPGPWLTNLKMSPRIEAPQPPWANCASTGSPSVKICFLVIRGTLLCSSFCPLPLARHHQKELLLFASSLQVFIDIVPEPSLLHAEQHQPCHPFFKKKKNKIPQLFYLKQTGGEII